MDNKLVLTFLFVTLSWMSVGTYAQNTTTASANMTTAAGGASNNMTNATMTTAAAGGASNNMTNMTMTTAAAGGASNNMTNMTMTTAAAGGASNNMTNMTMTTAAAGGASNNMTNMTMTTAAAGGGSNNMTNMTMTTAAAGGASNNMTNATMAPAMTTAAAGGNNMTLTPNTTVENLATPFNRSGCGTTQLCAAEPSTCDPSNSGSCFFLGAKQQSGQNFEFSLSGESEGYIAATLSTDSALGGNDTSYICANNNGTLKFIGARLDNGQLTEQTVEANSVQGRIDGQRIQCTFAATVPSSVTRAGTTNFALGISTGPFNATSGVPGAPTTVLRTAVVNLSNSTANTENQIPTNSTNTTATPTTTTSHAIAFQQSLTQALLVTAGVLGLAML